jgi:hypothetical protein
MACLRYNISKFCHISFKNQFNLKIDLIYNLYHSLLHLPKKKSFVLEICIDRYYLIFNFYRYYLVINFYQINKDDKIQTLDYLIIKILI